MADENKVIVRFNSIADDGEDQDILIEGPVKIYKSVDNVDALELLEVPDDEDVFVYVRNVIKSNTRQQSAFYLHSYADDTWKEVLLGGHSHHNKEILDQLGNIDVKDLADSNKILTIKAVDKDGVEGDYAYQYKLEWVDYPTELPEIPVDMQDRPVYLTVENGKYVWKDEIIPAQTFQYKQVIINSETPVKEFEVDDLNYDEKYDEILIFDGSNLLTDVKVEVSYDSESGNKKAILKLTSNDENIVFENGEKLTLLVIKSGVAGFMNQLADEYMKKTDVINLLSGGSISLDKYATKEDLKKYSEVGHSHSQYSYVGHLHDDRYAMYDHVHSQYITKSGVYSAISSVLANLLDVEDPNITIDNINDTLGESYRLLKDELLQEITLKADITYVDDQINILKRDYLNADNISISVSGRTYTLKDYISMLESSLSSMSNKTTDVKVAANIKVQTASGVNIGGYSNGDVIKADTTLHEFISTLMTQRIAPNLAKPSVDLVIDTENENYEVGKRNARFLVTGIFNQGDAGQILTMTLKVTKGTNVETYTLHSNTPYAVYEDIDENEPINFFLETTYEKGASFADNLGRTEYFIPAGSVTTNKEMKFYRKSFVGKYLPELGYRSAQIIDTPTGNFTLNVKGYKKLNDIILAFPQNKKITIQSVYYKNQGCEVFDLFDYKLDNIAGADNYSAAFYDIYTFHSDVDLDQNMNFEIQLKVGEN